MFNYVLSLILFIFTVQNIESRRNPLRNKDPYTPTLSVSYMHDQKIIHKTTDSLLELYPIFYTYDETFFKEHLLPQNTITFRNHPEQSISGSTLSHLINDLLHEISKQKKIFKDFIILKDQDFCYEQKAGALILKCRNFPFVVKLSIESPQSWISPYKKGFISWCHHVIGGGVSRHLCGFTRIKNREWAANQLQENPLYKDRVSLPRKWFWLPENPTYLKLTGNTIGTFEEITKEIPAIYAVVEDAIEIERTFSMRKNKDRKEALNLANYLHMRIDAHINNFVIEKNTEKLVLIDTELFTVLVGLKKPMIATGFASYYLRLIKKAFISYFFSTKEDRRKRQEELEKPCGLLD